MESMRIQYQHTNKEILTPQLIRDIILKQRLITNESVFLQPPHPSTIHLVDFGLAQEEKLLISTLRELKKTKKTIIVYCDYDADGITGGAILWRTLHLLGFSVMPYVPNRIGEGYGFSEKGIDTIIEKYSPGLIISVDHGISGRKQVSYAKKKGVPIIITDHHSKPQKLPDEAIAIIHISELSGSGVAYVVAKTIAEHFSHDLTLLDLFSADFLALATIGTVADLVPLLGPSRSIVKHGLTAFVKNKQPGLRTLLDTTGIGTRQLSPFDIGYILAPRINAVGRLKDATDALRLLCTSSVKKAQELARFINITNTKRQAVMEEYILEALAMVEKQYGESLPPVITLLSETWHEGVIGLIASKLVEKYFHPVIIMTKGEKEYKGSARSIPALHLTPFLKQLSHHLVSHGGHAGAAGFSIERKNIVAFTKEVQEAAATLGPKDFEKNMVVDIQMPFSGVTLALHKELQSLEPFGIGNIKPLFASLISIERIAVIGKQANHIRITAVDPDSSTSPIDMLAFGKAKEYHAVLSGKKQVQAIYEIDSNTWNGKTKVQGIIRHLIL